MSNFNDVSRRNLLKAAGGLGALGAFVGLGESTGHAQSGGSLELNVAVNGASFVFQGPQHDDGSPDFGATFIVDGVIYPKNTFSERGLSSGLNADGTAEFPGLVIGKWLCYGTFINQGMHTPEGQADVVTTQLFDFEPENPGAQTLITHGYEVVGLNKPFKRVLQGGTGIYIPFRGQLVQTLLAPNNTGANNVLFEI